MSLPEVYMVSVKNVADIFAAIRQAGVPDRFNNEYLKQLGFTSSNDRAFPVVLKALNFLDDNGVPTERYKRYRDPAISGPVMAEALRDAYSDLFKVSEKAQDMGYANLTGAVKRITGKTDSVSQKLATTFKALAKLSDWSATSVAPPSEEVAQDDKAADGSHERSYLSVPVVLHGVDGELAGGLRRRLRERAAHRRRLRVAPPALGEPRERTRSA